MGYDPAWWKTVFQVATFMCSALVIIGTAGSWYFGRREEAARETIRRAQHAEEQGRLTRIEAAITEWVAQGKLSKQDASRLQVILSEQLSLTDSVQVEVTKAPPAKTP